MNPIGIVRRLMQLAAWLHPHVQRWNQQRTRNRREADQHLQAGNYGEAEKSLRLILEEAKNRKKPGFKVGAVQLELAAVLLKLDRVDEAEALAKEGIATFGEVTTAGLELQAKIAAYRGNHALAQEQLKQAIHREEAPAKADLVLLSRLYQRLATSQILSGALPDAERSQTTALERLEQLHGASHTAVATARWNLGDIYAKQGKFQLAMLCFEAALEVHRATEGSDSPLVTKDLNSLANAAMETGDVERATKEYERTLSMMERQVGTHQADQAHVLMSLGRIYEASGRSAKAQEVVHQALTILERRGGPQLAEALELMARLFLRSGRYAEALTRFEKAQIVWMENSAQNIEQIAANAEQQEKIRQELASIAQARKSSAEASG